MKIAETSIRWAIKHVVLEGDTDLFPRPLEIDILDNLSDYAVDLLKDVNVGNYKWKPARRFVIPKTELSYRLATQLDPIDNIILAGIIYEYGHKIENKRRPIPDGRVFNYRFSPDQEGKLYKKDSAWKNFWQTCKIKSNDYDYVLQLDISDFYNQIYHHVIENQLIDCGFPNEIKNAIKRLLSSVTAKNSRGVPIGPHAVHLLAEMSLIPVDESLLLKGYNYCRFSDDIFIFCKNELDARIAVYDVASTLDRQQRLVLQNKKTKIYNKEEFMVLCSEMMEDNPLNDTESSIIKILDKYTSGDRYAKVNVELTKEESAVFHKEYLDKLILRYLETDNPDFVKIRWLYRRLAQIGLPDAIDVTISNIEFLIPALNDVCQYLISVANNFGENLYDIGENIAELLQKNRLINSNEFFQISLLSLYTRTKRFNHISKLIKMFPYSTENIKRKILLAAYSAGAADWIRELKENVMRYDSWNRRALLIGSSILATDERRFFVNSVKEKLSPDDYMEKIISEWVKKN